MYSLPYGALVDTLKCLNFEQLFSLKQTNNYFNGFISKYEKILPRKEFKGFSIISSDINAFDPPDPDQRMINLKSVNCNYSLTSQLEEKWKSAINNKISTSLNIHKKFLGKEPPLGERTFILIVVGDDDNELVFIVELPTYPKTISDMKLIRFCFDQLFRCAYKEASFDFFILNPEIIRLLFEDQQNISPKFYTKKVSLEYGKINKEKVLKFNLEHLIVNGDLSLSFGGDTQKYNDIVSELVLNGGSVIHRVRMDLSDPYLYNLIIKLIETSQDNSNMVTNFLFTFRDCSQVNVGVRAENIVKKEDSHEVKYQITNIYNKNLRSNVEIKRRRGCCIIM
uniref:F-box domain-containing protein n=1 Tax=Meloidogyne incognita TaxID=6306 RepID=A0A914NV61_MELIC